MYKSLFKTLRVFGLLPLKFSVNSKRYIICEGWYLWSKILWITYILSISTFRIIFYDYSIEKTSVKSFIYYFLLKYEHQFNAFYSFGIIYPIFNKNGGKKLQKCLNFLKEIQQKESYIAQRRIFYITMTLVTVLTLKIEVINRILWKCFVCTKLRDNIDVVLSLSASYVQSIILMFFCVVYVTVLERLKMIDKELKMKLEMNHVQTSIKNYTKCMSLIQTFNILNYFTLQTLWLRCVFDLLLGYKGCQMYIRRFLEQRNILLAISHFNATYWNLYNIPMAFYFFYLSGKVQNQVIFNHFKCFLKRKKK